jgi:hypothetical protein
LGGDAKAKNVAALRVRCMMLTPRAKFLRARELQELDGLEVRTPPPDALLR